MLHAPHFLVPVVALRPLGLAPRRLAVLALLALALSALAGCVSCGGEPGNGQAATETRTVAAFNEIEVTSVIELRATLGPTASLVLSGDSNLLPLVRAEVSGTRLVLSTTKGVRPKTPLVATVVVPKLTRVVGSGATRLELAGLDNDELALDCSGVCDIDAAGKTRQLTIALSGAGRADTQHLTAGSARVVVSGSGDVELGPTTELDVTISGAGSVSYQGDPTIKKSISGAGSLKKK